MKIVSSGKSKKLVMTRSEWEQIGLKFEEAKKKKTKKSKDYKYNPWAVCQTTVGKKENPEKFERCVKDVKKKQD